MVGRDARPSGTYISALVVSTLQAMGFDVLDAGLATTPSVAFGIKKLQAAGGIVVTASHNPKNWNALKLYNAMGEFLSQEQIDHMSAFLDDESLHFAGVDQTGKRTEETGLLDMHIQSILDLPLVDRAAIQQAGFRVAVDAVHSVGGLALPRLLRKLGVREVIEVYCEPTGHFPHNPEPLPENLTELAHVVTNKNAHLGLAVDPDVDRLSIVSEDGEMFGEEYTLVAVSDYVLSQQAGPVVSNLSSTQALKDVAEKHGVAYHASAVGEVKVVAEMKTRQAVIGGEGNGGVIYPSLHYGRDALVGTALFLSHLARFGKPCSLLRKKYPDYHISKNKIELSRDMSPRDVLARLKEKYVRQPMDTTDGIKIWFDKEWVHLRCSNTEPIIRVFAESDSPVRAEHLASKILVDIRELLKGETS